MDHVVDKARSMKLLLFAFEQVLGQKNNFHTSELFCFGETQEYFEQYRELFGCKLGEFPLKYLLGILIHYRKLRNAHWRGVEEMFEQRLSSWKGKHISTK